MHFLCSSHLKCRHVVFIEPPLPFICSTIDTMKLIQPSYPLASCWIGDKWDMHFLRIRSSRATMNRVLKCNKKSALHRIYVYCFIISFWHCLSILISASYFCTIVWCSFLLSVHFPFISLLCSWTVSWFLYGSRWIRNRVLREYIMNQWAIWHAKHIRTLSNEISLFGFALSKSYCSNVPLLGTGVKLHYSSMISRFYPRLRICKGGRTRIVKQLK